MPLTELVRHLNHQARHQPGSLRVPQPFASGERQVWARFAGLQLGSRFLPILERRSGRLHGHRASLEILHLERGTRLEPEALFVLPSDDEEFIYLDRLVRTLHALNYLSQGLQGNLLLQVHPRHVQSVPDSHGLAFEEILRPCGLLPTRITLELDLDGVEAVPHLLRAARNYHRRGYRIAVHRFGRVALDYPLLAQLQPWIVGLDSRLAGAHLAEAQARIQAQGALSLAYRETAAASSDLLLGTPRPAEGTP